MRNATSKFELRPLMLDDAPSLFDVIDRNREELKKFWWEEKTKTISDSRRFITAATSDEHYSGRPTRAATVDERLIGIGSLHSIDWDERAASLGYWIDKEASGHGNATKIAIELSEIAFRKLDLSVVTIACNVENVASRSVAEHAGFELCSIDEIPTWKKVVDQSTPTAHYQLHS